MRPLAMIKIEMFIILVGAVPGDTYNEAQETIKFLELHAKVMSGDSHALEPLKQWKETVKNKKYRNLHYLIGTMYYPHYKEWVLERTEAVIVKWHTPEKWSSKCVVWADHQEAMKWYTKAAANGSTKAQIMLGDIYTYGGQKNYQEAVKWYTKAAANGSTKAQIMLGLMYINRMGMEKNEKKGLQFIILAAQKGNAMAQYMSGMSMYSKKVYEEAYYWLTLAKKQEENLTDLWVKFAKAEHLDEGYWKDLLKKRQKYFEEEIYEGLITRLHELEDLIDHKKINNLQERAYGWKPKQLFGGGSGFYIKENLILTNAHVIELEGSIPCDEVRVQGDYHYHVDVIKKDSDVDLALLKISSDLPNKKHRPSAPFRSKSDSLQLGEGIAVFGYPLRGSLSFEGNFTIGNVSSMEGRPTEITPSDAFQFTAPIQPGNSGGPVLDERGNVAGVAVENLRVVAVENLRVYEDEEKDRIVNIAQNINFAVSLKAIRKFLKDAAVEPDSVSSSDTRKEWTEIARTAQKFTVPVLCFKNKQ